jgi:pimeloyl-ACP methyl ester carboxylesterase
MNKIKRNLSYSLISILVLLVLVFTVYGQKDIPIEKIKAKYGNTASRYLPLMGMQVHYRDEGNPADTSPLVLIHGTSSSLHTWDSLVSIMLASSNNKRRIIRFDLPAFGITGPNPENYYAGDYYVRFVDSFLKAMHINNCSLAGNSLGGAIAWQYTVAHPEKIAKLILIDAAGYPMKNEKGSLGFKLASTPVINNLLLVITPKFLVRKSLETVFYDNSLISDAIVTRYHEMLLREGNRAATLSIFKNRTAYSYEPIKTIKQPTLILWGEQDHLIAVENAYLFQKDIKGSILTVYKNIGHTPMEENPQAVAEDIQSFMNK